MNGRLRLAHLHYPVTALGPGTRMGVWTQGCPLACPGCMSRSTWDPQAGTPTDPSTVRAAWDRARAAGARGVTISGGEPLTQAEPLADTLDLLGDRGEADILLYTGYEPGELADLAENDRAVARCLARVDAVITGRYDQRRPTRLIWRGSANQRLIPLTARGRHRYRPHVDHAPDRPPMQVGADDDGGLWLIGVPRRGQLAQFTRALRDRGVGMEGVSWRPPPHTSAG
ncbi:radical SAM protein [Spiractinospora alimapuensis]|uniref:4Fe-4S single cluster domain-containing protein n=1 Tax=Spiractinospora alimapuensis TaxID=2820884 RepID=UPI001F325929|nr:4Fe-4S single cluster domain-containing protein [Spiractinospora alimapuensis]QVQ52572.1 radical SAM protein [Spiractinospora alimapuensis]